MYLDFSFFFSCSWVTHSIIQKNVSKGFDFFKDNFTRQVKIMALKYNSLNVTSYCQASKMEMILGFMQLADWESIMSKITRCSNLVKIVMGKPI